MDQIIRVLKQANVRQLKLVEIFVTSLIMEQKGKEHGNENKYDNGKDQH